MQQAVATAKGAFEQMSQASTAAFGNMTNMAQKSAGHKK